MRRLFPPLVQGSAVLGGTAAFSYALGVLRDRALAGTFGASDALDAYQAAFIIPDTLFTLFVAGALTAAFVPVYTDLRTRGRTPEASRLAGSLLTLGLLVLLVAGSVAFLLAGPLAATVAPGFPPAKRALLVQLTRLLLLSPLLFFASNLLGGMLVSTRRFFWYGLSPGLYNLGILFGAVVLAPRFGIHGVAVGTLLGAAVHLAVRIFDTRRAGLRPSLTLAPSPPFWKVVVLMGPRVVGLTAVQAQLWAFTAIASTLGAGAVTVVNFARNFQSFPVSLVGIAIATAVFPLLAESASRGSPGDTRRHLRQSTALALATVVPATLLLFLLRRPLVAFFLGTGAFDTEAVARTAATLGLYTLSIPLESLAHVLARAFYALQNTLLPVLASVLSIGISVAASAYLAPRLDVLAIPGGFTLGTAVQLALLVALLPWWERRFFRGRRAG